MRAAPAARRAPLRRSTLETEPRGNLERARSTRTERLAHALVGFAECSRHDQVVVEVGQVRHVEDVEDLTDHTQLGLRWQTERLGQAEVLRGEDVAESIVGGQA